MGDDSSKSPDAALIGGIIAGVASLLLLAGISYKLWISRKNGMRVSQPGSRSLRENGRVGTMASSVTALEDRNGVTQAAEDEKPGLPTLSVSRQQTPP